MISQATAASPAVSHDLFFKCHYGVLVQEMDKHNFLPKVLSEVIAHYLVDKDLFGVAQWRSVFDIQIEDRELPPLEFYRFWFGPDPLDPTQKNCETHLPPVLRPEITTRSITGTKREFSLEVLNILIAAPHQGFPTQIMDVNTNYRPTEVPKAGPACWVSMRKTVLTTGDTYQKKQAAIKELNLKLTQTIPSVTFKYEEDGPETIDLATLVLIHYVVTKKRYLSEEGHGEKTIRTVSVTKDIAPRSGWPVVVGGLRAPEKAINGVHGLDVYSSLYGYQEPIAAVIKI